MKRQYQHKKCEASGAMRESNKAHKKAGAARKSHGAPSNRSDRDNASALPRGFEAGEIETLTGLVTAAMSSLTAVRTILNRHGLNERQLE